MLRRAAFILICLSSSAAFGQAVGGPPIAFVTGSSKGDSIHLVYPDGTGLTKVYTAPRQGRVGSQIDRVSLRPGGGEIAFVLDNVRLMVQNHLDSGQPDGAAYEVDVPNGNCVLYDPDYRSDGSLVVADGCSKTWLVAPDATSATEWFSTGNIGALAALGTGLLYFETQSNSSGQLKLRNADGTTSTIATTTFTFPLYLDAVGNTALLSNATSFRTVNLTTGAIDTGCTSGGMVKYSPDGTQMLYEHRNILLVHNSDCSGAPFRLTRGAKSAAWRSN